MVGVVSCRVVTNVHAMNISRRKEKKMLLSGDNGVEILVMIFVEGSLREVVSNPEIHSLREAT